MTERRRIRPVDAGSWQPSARASDLDARASRSFLRRMGAASWPSYARTALVTGLAARRRGALGIAMRRLLYPSILRAAVRPVLLEDVVIRGPGRIVLGDGAMIEHWVTLDAKTDREVGIELGPRSTVRVGTLLDTGYTGWIRVGARTTIGASCEVRGLGGVDIGADCMVARNVLFAAGTHVTDDPDRAMTDQGTLGLPITIEDDVWLGANVVILGGVRIGRGAVVGANSLVNDDVPSGAVVVGTPAKVVRMRDGYGRAAGASS